MPTLQQLESEGYTTGGTGDTSPPPASSGQSYTLAELKNMGYTAGGTSGGLTSDQSATALGHSNSLLKNVISGAEGFTGDIANSALQFAQSAVNAPADIVSGVEGKGPNMAEQPDFTKGGGQQTIQAEAVDTAGQVFDQKESPLKGMLSSVGKVIGGALDFVTPGVAKDVAAPVAEKAADSAGEFLAKNADTKATKTAIKALTPKMTAGEIESAGKSGQATRSLLGGAKIDQSADSTFMKTVNAVKGIVKGKSAIDDTNAVRSALSTEADALKSKVIAQGKNVIYPFKELASKISDAEEPISLKGTAFEKQIAPLKEAAIKLAQKNGGNISGLFDTRKEFDELVDKTWPTLWDKENAPMRSAVTAVRNAMNDTIEDALPDAEYKKSLATQKSYYNAIDNLASKIPDEIKSTPGVASRVGKLAKKAGLVAGGAAIAGTIGEGAIETVKKLTGE